MKRNPLARIFHTPLENPTERRVGYEIFRLVMPGLCLENPKSEARNPKPIRDPKSERAKRRRQTGGRFTVRAATAGFRISSFGFRASDLANPVPRLG
jgi:hypothetical protein